MVIWNHPPVPPRYARASHFRARQNTHASWRQERNSPSPLNIVGNFRLTWGSGLFLQLNSSLLQAITCWLCARHSARPSGGPGCKRIVSLGELDLHVEDFGHGALFFQPSVTEVLGTASVVRGTKACSGQQEPSTQPCRGPVPKGRVCLCSRTVLR